MIHFTWLIFIAIIAALLLGIFKERRAGDYDYDLMPVFWLIMVIVFVLIWGGIFWW